MSLNPEFAGAGILATETSLESNIVTPEIPGNCSLSPLQKFLVVCSSRKQVLKEYLRLDIFFLSSIADL